MQVQGDKKTDLDFGAKAQSICQSMYRNGRQKSNFKYP